MMRPFQFHKITTHAEKSYLLQNAVTPEFISGGMTLLPLLQARKKTPTDLLDITGLPGMRDIDAAERRFRIGAAVPHIDVGENAALRTLCPAIGALARSIGDRHVQNRGTIGGSVARNDPASDYPAALVALNAVVETDARSIAAVDFFTGPFETALQDHELITGISFEIPTIAAYAKFPYPANGYAMVGIFMARYPSSVKVAVNGACRCGVFRLEQLEKRLGESFTKEAVTGLDLACFDIFDDRHGSRAYRENLIHIMSQRAVLDCTENMRTTRLH